MKLNNYIALLLTVAVIVFFTFAFFKKKIVSDVSGYKSTNIKINEASINTEIADTEEKQRLGLGEREYLDSNSGMLFPYPNKTYPYFWMKGMKIPIDIIWISENKIVGIEKNILPPSANEQDNRLPTYSPPVAVDYVLEVNAGFSDKHGFKAGDIVNIY